MPSIEFMVRDLRKFGGEVRGTRAFNLTGSVGAGCPNATADVKLVQCIFTTLAMNSPYTHLNLGTRNENIPGPNGRYTAAMGQVISNYQKAHSSLLLSADGRIHPASFNGRLLRTGGVRMMTIQMLNEHLGQTSSSLGASWDGGVDLVLGMFPELKALLTDKTQQAAAAAESGLQILRRNLLDEAAAMKEPFYVMHKAAFETLTQMALKHLDSLSEMKHTKLPWPVALFGRAFVLGDGEYLYRSATTAWAAKSVFTGQFGANRDERPLFYRNKKTGKEIEGPSLPEMSYGKPVNDRHQIYTARLPALLLYKNGNVVRLPPYYQGYIFSLERHAPQPWSATPGF